MALTLVHGSLATIDISIGGTSLKCAFGRWFAQVTRGSTSITTFCSNGWVSERPGSLQLSFQFDGFGSHGTTYSDLLAFVTASATVAIILTVDTGTTISFAGNVFQDSLELIAAGNAGRSISGRSDGTVVTAGFSA